MNAPPISREQLIADERAAESRVVAAESALNFARVTGTPDEIVAAEATLTAERQTSLATRQRMQEGLDAWTRYAAYQEAVAHAEANGLPVPTVEG